MHTVARPYAAVGAALAAAGVVVVAPISPRLSDIPLVSQAIRLVAGDSVLNVPFNFFQDLVNVPNTEVEAMQQLGESLMYSGPWWAASATNIWGEDPGDPGHFMSVVDMSLPFKELTGQGQGELQGFGDYANPYVIDPTAMSTGHMGLGQQIALFMDAELPVSASSDADYSVPMYPTTEITGSTFIDRNIWFYSSAMGQQNYPLFANWEKVPLSDLQNGYQFTDANGATGIVDPSQGVGPNGQVPNDYGFLGTHPATAADFPGGLPTGDTLNNSGEVVNANGHVVQLMPWADQTFKFDPAYPFQHFWDSLQQTPDTAVGPGGFEFPTLDEIGRSLQTLTAGSLIAFYSGVPGSATCGGGTCDIPASETLPALVKDIDQMWPGNTDIEHWLTLANTASDTGSIGATNAATEHQVAVDNAYSASLQQWFDIGNPTPDNPPSGVDTPLPFQISPGIQNLITFMHDSGVQQFFADWAHLAGYQTVDYNSLTAPTVAAAAGSSDWWTQLLGDFGAGDALSTSSSDGATQLLGDFGLGDLASLF